MREGDERRFASALARASKAKRRLALATVLRVFNRLWPDDARQPDARERLARLIAAGVERGLFRASTKQDRSGLPAVPEFIELPETPKAPRKQRPRVSWHESIRWAHDVRLSDRQFEMLRAVNGWLRDRRSDQPVVPVEERSLELFDYEKAITERSGGRTLWGPGRLSLELLRCERSTTPFVWERVGDGARLLVSENQATFLTLTRILRETNVAHEYAGVVWGQGAMAPSRIAYARRLPVLISAVDYLGDLDVKGLEAATNTCAVLVEHGIAAGPHARLWALLLSQEVVTDRSDGYSRARIERAVRWLPSGLRNRAVQIMTSGRRIPQERLGYVLLSSDGAWLG